jgi:toxin ParE1/3/4
VTLPIRWLASALDDLDGLLAYIAGFNVQAAEKLRERIEAAVLPLSAHPYLYRAGREPGTRELVAHPNYIVVYRVGTASVDIVHVLHARQKYP